MVNVLPCPGSLFTSNCSAMFFYHCFYINRAPVRIPLRCAGYRSVRGRIYRIYVFVSLVRCLFLRRWRKFPLFRYLLFRGNWMTDDSLSRWIFHCIVYQVAQYIAEVGPVGKYCKVCRFYSIVDVNRILCFEFMLFCNDSSKVARVISSGRNRNVLRCSILIVSICSTSPLSLCSCSWLILKYLSRLAFSSSLSEVE